MVRRARNHARKAAAAVANQRAGKAKSSEGFRGRGITRPFSAAEASKLVCAKQIPLPPLHATNRIVSTLSKTPSRPTRGEEGHLGVLWSRLLNYCHAREVTLDAQPSTSMQNRCSIHAATREAGFVCRNSGQNRLGRSFSGEFTPAFGG